MRPWAAAGTAARTIAPNAAALSRRPLRTSHLALRTSHLALLLQQLQQIVFGLGRLHDRQLLYDLFFHLDVLLGARQIDERPGVVLDEEALNDGLADFGARIRRIDRSKRVAGPAAAQQAQVVNRFLPKLDVFLAFRE